MKGIRKKNGSKKFNPVINEKFSTKISEIIPSILYILDVATFKNVYLNKEASNVLGYPLEEVTDIDEKFLFEKMHPNDQPLFLQHFEKLKRLKKEEVLVFEYRLKSSEGKWLWFQSRDTAYEFNAKGSASLIIGTAIDITERKEKEQKLKISQEQLFEAQAINKLGYYSFDLLTGVGTGSSLFYQISGIDEGVNLDNEVWIQLVHPDFKEKFRLLIQETIKQKLSSFEIEYKIIHLKTKEEKWVRGLGKLIYNKNNEAVEIFGTVQDITQQMEVREKLTKSNNKLDNIIRHSSSLFYTHTPEGYITYLSPQSKALLDCEPEIAKTQWQEFLTANSVNSLGVNLTSKAIKTGKKQPQYELELKTRKGRIIWVLVDESPVVKNGETIAVVGSLTDITKRKNLESRLKNSEERLRLVIESSPVGLVLYTPQGKLISYNKRFNELFGYLSEDIPNIEEWFLKAYPVKKYREQVKKKWEEHVNEYFLRGSFFSFEASVTCKNGDIKNIEFGFGAIEDLYITTFVDVTERNNILNEIERNKVLLNENEQLSKTGAWEYNINTKESFWTDGLYSIHELDNKGIKDKIAESFKCYNNEAREEVSKAFENTIKKGKQYDLSLPFTTFKGNHKWIRTKTRPILEGDKVVKIIGSLMDVTEQINNEIELKELNATKDKLFSIVSHDLKNPIGAIINLAELALNRIDSITLDDLKRYLDVINRSGQRSIDLLNNLLEWSAINSGRIKLYTRTLKLYPNIEDIGELFKTQIHNKKIAFNNLVPKDFTILADEKLMNTVLRNLISNAIKFTPENGAISLNAKHNASEIEIEVSDTGVGIDKNDIEKLFDSNIFFSKNGTNNERGSGLGLMLCKEFVKMHKGQISIESELGKGTTFYIILPVLG